MRLVSHESAQLLYLVPISELRPLHGLSTKDFIEKTVARYEFATSPTPAEVWAAQQEAKGIRFRGGRIVKNGNFITIPEFGIYDDGILISSFVTDDADVFLDDFLSWAGMEFGLRESVTPPQWRYDSRVVIQFGVPVETWLRDFHKFAAYLSAAFQEDLGIENPVALNSISWRCDPLTFPVPNASPQFFIERRAGRPFEEDRYFSIAPLKTKSHVAALEKLEELFST